MKIQIFGGKVYLKCRGKTLPAVVCSVMPNILSDKAIDIEGITAIRELQRKQVRLLKYKVSPYAPS